jgi:hypothetical protein
LLAVLAGFILEEAGVTLDGFPGLLGFEAPVPGLTPELIGLLGFALEDEAAALSDDGALTELWVEEPLSFLVSFTFCAESVKEKSISDAINKFFIFLSFSL